MAICACGNPANGSGTTCQRCAALYELGLKADATDAEVKTAYRLYVKAWHPDRFPEDEKFKIAAQEKLKTINSAYDFLTSSSSKEGQRYRPKAAAPPTQSKEQSQQKQSSARQLPPDGGHKQASPPKWNTGTQAQPPTPSAARRWGIFFGLLVGRHRRAPRWAWVASAAVLLAAAFGVWFGSQRLRQSRPPETLPSDFNGWDENPAQSAQQIKPPKGFTLDTTASSNGVRGLPPGARAYPIDNPPQPAFSLPNGTEIRKRRSLNGRGELTVENGTLDDAVVHLVDLNTEKTIRTFYVKADDTFIERQIPPGLYGLYYTTGIDWNVGFKTFNLNASYRHFGENLEYTEKVDQDTEKIEKIIYKISLQPVQDGNAKIEPSDKDTFDKMMDDGNTE